MVNSDGNSNSNSDGRSNNSEGINILTGKIIGGAIEVHRYLGPGLLESTYEACLAAELKHRGLLVERQVPVRVRYRDVDLECGLRNLEAGLLLNFNVEALAAGGIRRVVWGRKLQKPSDTSVSSEPSASSRSST